MKYNKLHIRWICAVFAYILATQVPKAELVEMSGYSLEIRHDTLFVSGDSLHVPSDLIVVLDDQANLYQKLFHDETDDLMEDHPAADLYKNIWTRERINAYNTPIDSLPDSVYINCQEFCLPAQGYITSKFGPRRYRFHYGTDVKVQIGDTIRSAFSGQVRIIDYEAGGYGHYVVVRHDNGLETVYAHLSKVLVDENMHIACGEPIGLGGNTGRSTGSHLHFETRYLGNAIDPELIVDFSTGNIRNDQYLIAKNTTFKYYEKQKALAAAKYYTVRRGDNLSAIARRYGTSVKNICRLSGIKATSVLRVGQRLRIR